MPPTTLPTQARVVIIGGGIIGCSVAYHLAKLGWRDVVLLERDRLTSGTTWHAAGLMVTFGSTSETSTEMRKYTRDLYARLEAETGQATGFKPVGFIELATDADRLEEFRRVAAFNRYCGIDVQELGPQEVKSLFPLAKVDDVRAGFYVASDGRVNPVDATMALAKGARMQGVQILEEMPVTAVLQKGGQVTGVRTAAGDIHAEFVVNCAGMWARQLGELSGVPIPLQAAEHYYLITDRVPGISAQWPILEDPSSYGYYREEVGGLMIGLFEPESAPWQVGRIPEDFSFGEITPDWDRMGPFLEKAMARVPISANLGIRKFFCGPESFTPDLRPVVGEAPELKNYFVAAGLNSIGILTGGGLGRLLAHWIVHGRPDMDVTAMDIDRLQAYQNTPSYRRARIAESLGMVYKCHYPTMAPQTARGAKHSPLHQRLQDAGAYFRDVSGWESPDWYAPQGVKPEVTVQGWGRLNWFPYWQAEHEAARQAVVIMDMSFMAKFRVHGPDAGAWLNWLSANEVNGTNGQITYTQWLDDAGLLQADLTVTRCGEQEYWVVASDTAQRHVWTWMQRHLQPGQQVGLQDVTTAYAQINVQGPKSQALLQKIVDADLSTAVFPYRTARSVAIGFAQVLCVRITYVGELGYELYVPVEQAVHVYDQIVDAGRPLGLQHAGLKALASLRLEKGYRDYGHDIDNTDCVLEAGLGFALDLAKPAGFLGRDAVLAKKALGPLRRRMVQVQVMDAQPLLYHAEIVWRNDVAVGYVRAGSYGHTLGGAVGLAMVQADQAIDNNWISQGSWQVEIAGQRYPALASLRPLYDPTQARIKA